MANYVTALGIDCKGNGIARQVKSLKKYRHDKLYNCCLYTVPANLGLAGVNAVQGEPKCVLTGLFYAAAMGPVVAYLDTIAERKCLKALSSEYKKNVNRAKQIYKNR